MASNSSINTGKKQISLKLVVDTEGQRVVFAEAGNDFVDFLYNISHLPFGTVMKLFAEQWSMEGCIGNIYKGIEEYGNSIKQPSRQKDGLKCFPCGNSLDVANPGSYGNGNLKYVVMDDLSVMPVSAVCVIRMLNQYQIKDIGTLETREVYLGMDEVLNLLKASMHSKTVLTDVYLCGQDELLGWLKKFASL